MPVTVSYPGVYIEEIPSGVHTITGVATSIAAFVGWAAQGPADSAQLVLSWTDYVRQYGGLDPRSLLGYAVSQFFSNGGSQAYIVRLVAADAATAAVTLDGKLKITAQDGGAWANNYAIAIKNQSGGTNRFRLQVAYVDPTTKAQTTVESFENLSMVTPDPQGRFVEDVVNNQSNFLTASVQGGATTPPADTPVPLTAAQQLTGGADGTVLQPNAAAFETALVPAGGVGGIYLLDHVDLFNLLCVPGETTPAVLSDLEGYCHDHRAFLIADCPQDATVSTLKSGPNSAITG